MERINRRRFLAESIRGATGMSLGMTTLSMASGGVVGANNKVVLALIGAGRQGHKVITRMTKNNKNVETKYVCEVDSRRGAGVIQELEQIQGYAPKRVVDMREVFDDKDVDGVVIATPEHWHALATIWACQAGKDVFVEKDISLAIWEGRKMVEAARKYKRIIQCGTQNRSAPYGYTAREYIKSGKLGKVILVKVYNLLHGAGGWKVPPDSPVPPELNWNLWLGPAPKRPYNKYIHKRWAKCWTYGTGEIGHSASHQLDFARLVIGDPPHPKSVYCAGGRLAYDDKRDTPDLQAITYDYGDFVMTMDLTDYTPYFCKSAPDIRFGDKFPDWLRNATRVEVYGTKGIMYVGRMGGGWQVFERKGKGETTKAEVIAQEHGRYPSDLHEANFIDCIRSRKMSNGDVEQGHYSDTLGHLANVAYRVGNKQLLFDGKTERFLNSDDANKLLKPTYRKPFYIPEQV